MTTKTVKCIRRCRQETKQGTHQNVGPLYRWEVTWLFSDQWEASICGLMLKSKRQWWHCRRKGGRITLFLSFCFFHVFVFTCVFSYYILSFSSFLYFLFYIKNETFSYEKTSKNKTFSYEKTSKNKTTISILFSRFELSSLLLRHFCQHYLLLRVLYDRQKFS